MDSISDRCVACTRKVSARQHALLCDGCNRWQHRICDTEDDHQLPNVRNLQRLANRIREDLRPAEPRDLEFIIDTDYLQCQDFLVGDIHVDTERHLVFSTPNQLRILQQARRWFCDGTFKILARPFQQLWSIHAFVCRGDSYKQVPLVFCLMSRRKSRDYAAIFKKLKEIIPGVPQVQTFVVDFEKGAWKAIREEFPNTLIKGCAFHFGQAVWRKVQELGLRTTYTKRGAEYRYIRSLMALPFLPSADIQPAFDRLSARATSQELQQLVAYMDSNWIGSAVWQPRNWSIFQTNVRTNNDVEGWHTRINADIGKANAAFYILVPALQREARLVDLTVRLVSEEQILRCQRRRYQDLTCRLHEAWDRYTNGELTASQLLRECGGVYGPNND